MDDMLRRPSTPRIQLDSDQPQSQEAIIDASELKPTLGSLAVAAEQPDEYNVQDYEDPKPEQTPEPEKKGRKKRGKRGFKVPTPKTKKQWILAVAIMLLALGGAGFAVYWFIIRETPAPVTYEEPEPYVEPAPEPIYSTLSGREITDETINDRPIFAVQIENSPEARPQSGLKEASIVSEFVAEGGITRFNAIFQDNLPKNVGPIRSLRPYFIDAFMPYDASIVHAGGSGEALGLIRSLGLKDLDESTVYMRRISERYAPHNLYSTGKQLLDVNVDRKYKVKDNIKWLDRKDAEPAEEPTAKTINITISSYNYNVKYTWDKETNTYRREQGGAKHIDAESKKQLAPDVVIVPIMSKSPHPDGVHTKYTTTGSGKVYVFQDGKVTTGTWSKSKRSSQWVLKDGKDKVIALNRGQTWFTVTDASNNVKYTP